MLRFSEASSSAREIMSDTRSVMNSDSLFCCPFKYVRPEGMKSKIKPKTKQQTDCLIKNFLHNIGI